MHLFYCYVVWQLASEVNTAIAARYMNQPSMSKLELLCRKFAFLVEQLGAGSSADGEYFTHLNSNSSKGL